jgi:hypothetical protein
MGLFNSFDMLTLIKASIGRGGDENDGSSFTGNG